MAYRRTPQIEARQARIRERIVEAARRLVAEGGFREAQVAAVAAAAGVATGSVYRHFPSKADLLREVMTRVVEREFAVVRQIAEADGPAAARLADAVRAFAARALRGPRLAYAMLAEPVDPEIEAARLEWHRAYGRVFEGLLREGMAAGELRAQDPRLAAACLVGAFMDALVGPLSPDAATLGEAGRERVVEGIVAFCLGAVGGEAAARVSARPELQEEPTC